MISRMGRRLSNLKYALPAILLFLAACQGVPQAERPTHEPSFDPIVIVHAKFPFGIRSGNGFVIGDGTLVVTAHHLVVEESSQGEHSMNGLVSVVSPFLGDACDAEVLVLDKGLDLALLRTSWNGHPSFAVADDQSLLSAERLLITGMPDIVPALDTKTDELKREWVNVKTQSLPVDFIALRNRIPRFIQLAEIGDLGKGWSGSPMLLQGAREAAGCFTQIIGRVSEDKRKSIARARGPALAQLRHHTKDPAADTLLPRTIRPLSRPRDAIDAFLMFLRARRDFVNDRYSSALEHAQAFVRLRPQSVLGYRLAAKSAAEQERHEQAEALYEKALALDPKGAITHLLYAEFLAQQGKEDEAFGLLENLSESGTPRTLVAYCYNNILTKYGRGEHVRCAEYLTEALKEEPRNAYLWVNLGVCQYKMKDNVAAASSYARAVELMPERGPFRGALAQLLEMTGKLDEAERHFRRLLEVEPENPVVYFWLAGFLAKHRPNALGEAIKVSETALGLPERRGLSRQKIEELLGQLRARADAEQEKADEGIPEKP